MAIYERLSKLFQGGKNTELLETVNTIEIYYASKLFYTANFYQTPEDMNIETTNAFIDFIQPDIQGSTHLAVGIPLT